MKHHVSMLFLLGFFTLFLTSCWPVDDPDPDTGKGNEFLFLYTPDNTAPYGNERGFFKVTAKDGEMDVKRLNDFYPNSNLFDVNENGLAAFRAHDRSIPENAPKHSKIAYFNLSNPGKVEFIPPPAKPADWHWVLSGAQKPQVLKDGRIVVPLNLTVDAYEDESKFYMGVYDTKTGDWTISPDISDFVMAQPEKRSDTEGGLILNSSLQVLSPDESRVYISVQGYGVSGGVNHYDEVFLAYYDIGKNDFVRVKHGKHNIVGASNKSVLYMQDGKLYGIELSSKKEELVDATFSGEFTGAATKDEIIRTWRGSGLAVYERVSGSFQKKHVINTDVLTERKYRGLGSKAFYTNNEKELLFSATTDFNTNNAAELVIYKSPIIAENPDPELILTLPKSFSAHFKLIK